MAKISTYPVISTPSLNDLLIGTDVDNLNITKNFAIGDIASFIIGGSYVPYTGANKNLDLGIYSATGSAFIVNGGTAAQFLKANGTLDSTVYQPAGNYITQLSGEATASGPGNATVTLSNTSVIGKVLTGLTITGSVITAADSILTAFGKVQNQINTLVGGVQYKGTWNAATNTPTLVSSVGVSGNYYVVSTAGNTNLNGITDWQLGDWAIFNGSAWEKVDNTDAVISVNGQIGAVVLTTTNIAEGTNLYYTNTRARLAINLTTTGNSGAATYNNTNGFFNIPEYTLAGLGGVPLSRTITINGVAQDLSANRTYNVGTVTSVATTAPLTGGTITGAGTLGITQSGSTADGFLSSTDWTTFNNKQNTIVNPVTGTGTVFTLPMWGSASSLINSPLSYVSDTFNFQYNSPTGGTVVFTNSGLTTYAYTIQMNNFGSPRSTVHSYTDGIVVQSIAGVQVSRVFANGNTVLGAGVADNGHKLELSGSLFVNTIANATIDTDRFLVSDSGVIKYRTGTELRSDIGAGVGSVTSVGLTMPSAFSVANSPITGSGTLAVTGAGNAGQYVRGDGTLADFPTSTGGGSSISYYLNGSVSQGTIGGVAYRELSKVPIFGAGTDISIASDGYIASFITDAGDPNLLNIPAGNWNFETYFSASSGGGTPSFYVELYRYDGATFTLIASSVGVPELISLGTAIQPYFSTLAVPQTALAVTDRLAIRYYVIHSGRTITLHTENGHLCQIVTTFSTGLTALNGLTAQVQFFQVGTAGTDFNISSVSPTHTFNLPTASAINRGALSSSDFTTFNSKIGGTLATGQVAFGTAANTVGGVSGVTGLTYDNTNSIFRAVGVSVSFSGANRLINTHSDAGRLILNGGVLGGSVNNPEIQIGSVSNLNSIDFRTNNILRWSILSTGQLQSFGAQTIQTSTGALTLQPSNNVLIGTTTDAGFRLDVNGTARVQGELTVGNGTDSIIRANSSVVGNFQTTFIQASTANTSTMIQIRPSGTNNSMTGFNLTDSSTSALDTNTMLFGRGNATLPSTGVTYIGNIVNNRLSANSLHLGIILSNTSISRFEALRIWNSGNMVIQNGGTFTDAGFRLDVNGTARVQGVLTLTGALNGTSAVFSGGVSAANATLGTLGSGSDAILNLATNASGGPRSIIYRAATAFIDITNTAGSPVFQLSNGGAATFSSSVTALNATFKNQGSSPNNTLFIQTSDYAGGSVGSVLRLGHVATTGNSTAIIQNLTAGGTTAGNISFPEGNVGIGTVTPASRFEVVDGSGSVFRATGNGTNVMEIGNYKSNGSGYQQLDIVSSILTFGTGTAGGGSATERMRITSGGNILIGTTSDNGSRLQVEGGNFRFNWANASTSYYLWLNRNSTQDGGILLTKDNVLDWQIVNISTSGNLVFYSYGSTSNALTLTRATGAATFSSSVTALNAILSGTGSAFADGLRINRNSNTNQYTVINHLGGATNIVAVDQSGNNIAEIYFGRSINGSTISTSMVINSTGNVGVGTDTPTTKTQIVGSAATGGVLRIENNRNQGDVNHGTINIVNTATHAIGNDASIMFSAFAADVSMHPRASIGMKVSSSTVAGDLVFNTRDNITFAERMRITSGGNVLIGTTTDDGYRLNVAGNAQIVRSGTSTALVAGLSGVTGSIIRFSYNGGFVGSISTDGSNTAYNTSSDYRLKQDIKDFNGLDLLSRIKTYDFEWKSDKTRSYGVLAHELQEVINYAVTGSKNAEDMQGVDYSKIVPILIKAIQELNEKIK